jgi:hypothetical protein
MVARFSSLCFLLCVVAFSTGCQGHYYLSDDIDFDFDLFALDGPSGTLHSPYVTGAQFVVSGHHTRNAERYDWTIESSNSRVLRVESSTGGVANVVALAPGQTTLRIRRGAEILHQEEIEVRAPARADVLWHGTLLLKRSEEEAKVEDAQVLVGGTATFLVRWLDENGERLAGNGALQATSSSEELIASVQSSNLFERRDWLMLTPLREGEYQVSLRAGEVAVGSFRVVAVDEDAVANIVIEGQSEQEQPEGALLVALASAEDAEGKPIFGVEYEWDIEGESLLQDGDVLKYTFDPNRMVNVGATFGEQRAEARLHAGDEFYVESTTAIGCNAGGRASLSSMLAFAFAALLMVIRRARKWDRAQGLIHPRTE